MNTVAQRLLAALVVCALAACAAVSASADAPTGSIDGNVVSASDGTPLAGATVAASSSVAGAAVVAPVTTDSGGNFAMTGLTVGDEYSLNITDPGFASQSVPVYASTVGLGEIELTPDAVWGTVADATTGKPIAGELVELLGATGSWQVGGPLGSDQFSGDVISTVSGADGSFAFLSDQLTSGEAYKLYFSPYAGTVSGSSCAMGGGCSLSGYVPAYAGGTTLATATTISNAASVSYDASLHPYASVMPITVAGQVATQLSANTTAPAANVTVRLQSMAGTTVATTSTDADGVYGFGAAAGNYRVYIPAFCSGGTCYQAEYANGVAAARLASATAAGATIGWLATAPTGGTDVYATGSSGGPPADAGLWPVVKSPPAWLKIIDYWRSAAGLLQASTNVVTDRNLTMGLKQYALYEEKTPATYKTGEYASPHIENPASPYYTKLGAAAAGAGDLYEGRTGKAAINGWLGAPFHATAMFGANTTTFDQGNADGLSTLGYDTSPEAESNPDGPILFPGPGSTTTLLSYSGGEDPDPLATCGRDYENAPPGLPLILMNLAKVPAGVAAALRGPTGTATSANGRLCVEDSHDYRPGTGVLSKLYGKRFFADDQIFLIPKQPLKPGRYTVTVTLPGESTVSWSFRAAASDG